MNHGRHGGITETRRKIAPDDPRCQAFVDTRFNARSAAREGRRRLSTAGMVGALLVTMTTLGAAPAAAQTGGTCVPAAQRAGRALGCFITAREELGALPRDSSLYWHLDVFPTRAGADRARTGRGTVVTSLGRVWLFTIAGLDWRPRGGKRITRIGPLPLVEAPSYAAVYMEGLFEPGMQSAVHRHPGVEAWYTLDGAQCLETPEGKLVQRAGGPGVMVRGGLPMRLTGVGTGIRRSVVLILQDAAKPRSTPASDWTPKGLCQQ